MRRPGRRLATKGQEQLRLIRGEVKCAERVLVDADSVLDGGIGRSSLERLGEQEHAAGEMARAQGA